MGAFDFNLNICQTRDFSFPKQGNGVYNMVCCCQYPAYSPTHLFVIASFSSWNAGVIGGLYQGISNKMEWKFLQSTRAVAKFLFLSVVIVIISCCWSEQTDAFDLHGWIDWFISRSSPPLLVFWWANNPWRGAQFSNRKCIGRCQKTFIPTFLWDRYRRSIYGSSSVKCQVWHPKVSGSSEFILFLLLAWRLLWTKLLIS